MFADSPTAVGAMQNPLPVEMIDIEDTAEATLYLCARSGHYVTGPTLTVDAGYTVK